MSLTFLMSGKTIGARPMRREIAVAERSHPSSRLRGRSSTSLIKLNRPLLVSFRATTNNFTFSDIESRPHYFSFNQGARARHNFSDARGNARIETGTHENNRSDARGMSPPPLAERRKIEEIRIRRTRTRVRSPARIY